MIEHIPQLATAAITALIPYLVKGGESIAGEAGKNLFNWIKNKFISKGKESDIKSLSEKPDDHKIQGRLEAILQTMLEENQQWAPELKQLVDAASNELVQQGNSINIQNSEKFIVGPVNAQNLHLGDNNTKSSKDDEHKQ